MNRPEMTQPQTDVAGVLRHLALDERVKRHVLATPELYQPLLCAASRYIGGESLNACLEVARQTNQLGHAVTIDFMGESTRDRVEAATATAEFIRVAEAIATNGLNASISLDLSHIGLVLDEAFCLANACAIAEAAAAAGTEVMISAEGTDRTDAVLRMHGRIGEKFENIGITLQAFLFRSPGDLNAVLGRPGKVRIVKGAFEAPAALAMSRGADLDAAYLRLIKDLVVSAHPCSVATHDPRIISAVEQLLEGRSGIEFEMLRGVTPELLAERKRRGFPTRVYLPYGREWYLYLLNRLAEHPLSLFDAIVAAGRMDRLSRDETSATPV